MQNISLPSLGMRRKQNFDTAVLNFTFHVLSYSFFWLFLPPFFSFSVIYNVESFILLKVILGKLLGFDERKGRRVVEQDFQGNSRSMLHGFLHFSLVSLTELGSF